MQGNKIDHNGIKVELLGQIEMYFDRGNDMTLLPSVIEYSVPSMFYTAAVSFSFNAELLTAENYIFILLSFAVRELDVPGNIYERKTYPFEFPTVEMPYETYNGVNVRLRYVLKVTINCGYAGSIVEYQDFAVRNYSPLPPINNSIKMEVGIEDCLHIEFE
ncbi:vacuolar protein sorting-associated protein 26A [Trifolium repens]|nr:vacuolar protein sorting-associated protein 26A [Trifolium repens]